MSDARCPKSMSYGPCGGVDGAGGCEVDQRPCPFLHDARVPDEPGARLAVPIMLPHPVVAVDVRAPSEWDGDLRRLWRRVGQVLQGCVALLGEHVDNPRREDDSGPVDPVWVVEILAEAGVPVIVTVTGRDRELVEAQRTIDRYRAAGACAVHCVTGDHPAAMGIGRSATFGCESVTLVAAAAEGGMAATVAESPASPGDRIGRLLRKERVGASACILNHHGSASDMEAFADACRGAGLRLPLIAPVPMIGSARSALALAKFPGVRVSPDLLQRVMDARDPASEGRAVALEVSKQLAQGGRFAGVTLSGSTGATDPWERLRIAGDLAQDVLAMWA